MLSQSSQQKTQLVAVGGFGQEQLNIIIISHIASICQMIVDN